MENIIYWVGIIVIVIFIMYMFLYFLYSKFKAELLLDVETIISTNSMPALKPIPIPTKKQKTLVHKFITFVFEVRKWEVVENWHYQLDDKVELIIPKGFCFDGASIPRPFWAILNPVGLLLIPGLLHDYGYKYDQLWQVGPRGNPIPYEQGKGKKTWDDLFRKVGKDVNGILLINILAWLAVTTGGDAAWDRHRKAGLKAEEPT